MNALNTACENSGKKAWVVFSGQTDLPWLKVFRPGFRHCFVLLNDGRRWISLDPLSNYTEISVHHHVAPEFNLPGWLESRGHRVVETHVERRKEPAPFMLYTCVEAVKRVLGLHARFIFTPWQLYRFLQGQHSHSHHEGEKSWAV
ncbi:MAG TPA: hypothetical protein DEA55_04155 [Rhodospirillaceae bacterium]|nr:hypothetical protein [Rhodospirillaceae bacterium]